MSWNRSCQLFPLTLSCFLSISANPSAVAKHVKIDKWFAFIINHIPNSVLFLFQRGFAISCERAQSVKRSHDEIDPIWADRNTSQTEIHKSVSYVWRFFSSLVASNPFVARHKPRETPPPPFDTILIAPHLWLHAPLFVGRAAPLVDLFGRERHYSPIRQWQLWCQFYLLILRLLGLGNHVFSSDPCCGAALLPDFFLSERRAASRPPPPEPWQDISLYIYLTAREKMWRP